MVERAWIGGGVRLIKMMVELHRRGLQHLRIFPYEYPLAWRLQIAQKAFFSPRNGAFMLGTYEGDETFENASYTSANKLSYFGWNNVDHLDAEHLAGKFMQAFPKLCEAGSGRDWEYAGWLSELSGHISRTRQLPFVMAEYFEPDPEELTYLPLRDYARSGEVERFPLPPPPAEPGLRALTEYANELRCTVEELRAKIERAKHALHEVSGAVSNS
jgi:hypothetical protein